MTSPSGSRWSGPLLTGVQVPELDLPDWIGQRTSTFRFEAVDIVTGYRTVINPIADTTPVIVHDTGRTITRTITGLQFGVTDTAILDSIRTRLYPWMWAADRYWPLGVYVFSTQNRLRLTAGVRSTGAFYDQMFIVDQQAETSFGNPDTFFTPAAPAGIPVQFGLDQLLSGLPITYTIEPTPFRSIGVWPAGTSRGQIAEQLALDGDHLSPWFDHSGVLRFIRSFDPATAAATFDLDSGNRVLRDPVPLETDDLITAPNRVIVIGNAALSAAAAATPTVGRYDIPSSAPHSIANRGFVIPQVINRQVQDTIQAQAIAQNIGQRLTVFERVELSTAPDPRHDSYDVIRWQGHNWLEIAWSLPLREGEPMRHVLRRAYL